MTMHLLMSVAVFAPIVLVGLLYLLCMVAMAHWEEEDHSWSSDSRSAWQDGDWTHSDAWGSEAWTVHPGLAAPRAAVPDIPGAPATTAAPKARQWILATARTAS